MPMTLFAVTVYGQYCRHHVLGQRDVSYQCHTEVVSDDYRGGSGRRSLLWYLDSGSNRRLGGMWEAHDCLTKRVLYGTWETVTTAPAAELHYVTDFDTQRRLWSALTASLIVQPTLHSSIGDRSFPVAAAHTWNSLPPSSQALRTFPKRLKTELFQRSHTTPRLSVFYLFIYLFNFLFIYYIIFKSKRAKRPFTLQWGTFMYIHKTIKQNKN